MIDVQSWMRQAVALLQEQFGSKLLFVGLQGSHRRGEAREDSDIDILTVLESVDLSDLVVYRTLLRTLPEGEKAGGFTCGRQELLAWPPAEIFQFAQDTDAYYGDLSGLLPKVTREDIITGVRMSVSGLHHLSTYLFISSNVETRATELQGLYKGAFFALQVVEYLRSGVYAQSKKELLSRVSGDEAELLRLSMDPGLYEKHKEKDPESLFQRMIAWTGNTMRELAAF